jgi:hypothetical protein
MESDTKAVLFFADGSADGSGNHRPGEKPEAGIPQREDEQTADQGNSRQTIPQVGNKNIFKQSIRVL